MPLLLAEGGFLSELAALITAVAGLIAAFVAWGKFLKEQRKRTEAESRRKEAVDRQEQAQVKQAEEYNQRIEAERREAAEHEQRIEAEKRKKELEEAVGQLETILAQMPKLNAPNGEPMDVIIMQQMINKAVQPLIARITELTGAVNQLGQEVAGLKQCIGTLATIEDTLQGLHQLVAKLEQRVTSLEQKTIKPEPDPEPKEDGTPPPPWPPSPPGEKKPIWFRGRVYRFVRFGGNNSRIETLNGSLDPLGELRAETGAISNSGTISNNRLFNDRQGRQPITSADHP